MPLEFSVDFQRRFSAGPAHVQRRFSANFNELICAEVQRIALKSSIEALKSSVGVLNSSVGALNSSVGALKFSVDVQRGFSAGHMTQVPCHILYYNYLEGSVGIELGVNFHKGIIFTSKLHIVGFNFSCPSNQMKISCQIIKII